MWERHLAFGIVLLFCVKKINHVIKSVEVTFVVDAIAIVLGETGQKKLLTEVFMDSASSAV